MQSQNLFSKLPLEIKINILTNVPFKDISFFTDDYFWQVYCNKFGIKEKILTDFTWKSNYVLQKRFPNLNARHIISLRGQRIYFGRYNYFDHRPDYTGFDGNRRYKWFHIFYIDKTCEDGCHMRTRCVLKYVVFQGSEENSFDKMVDLRRFRNSEKIEKKQSYPLDEMFYRCPSASQDYAYISLRKHCLGTVSVCDAKNGVSVLKQKGKPVGIVIASYCWCYWLDTYESIFPIY